MLKTFVSKHIKNGDLKDSPNVRRKKLLKAFVSEQNGDMFLTLLARHRHCCEKWQVGFKASHGEYVLLLWIRT